MLRKSLYLCLVLTSSAAHGQAFKCVDPAGRITFSQTPCPFTPGTSTEVKLTPSSPSSLRSQTAPISAVQKGAKSSNSVQTKNEATTNISNQKTLSTFPNINQPKLAKGVPSNGCQVTNYSAADQTSTFAQPLPGGDYMRVNEVTERCANVEVTCGGGGSRLVNSSKLIASFADGKSARSTERQGEDKRVNSGESTSLFACFGTNGSSITKISIN